MKTVLYDLTPLDTQSRVRGIGRYVRELAKGLARLGPQGDLRIVGLTRLGWDGEHETTDDIGSFEGNRDVPQPTQADHYRWAYRRRVALFRAARRLGADLVHLGDPNATPLLMSLAPCVRVVTCHDLIPARFPERYYSYKDGGPLVGRLIEMRRYRSADLVVAISDATADDLVRFMRVPRERIVRVYNGVDVERWGREPDGDPNAIAQKHGLARPFVLYVGDGDWRKNADGMMAGLARAREGHGLDVELAWAGHLKPERAEEIDRAAERAGVAHAVRRLGFVSDDDLAALYRVARAHLFVSRAEGFGLTVVEAMAAGCPVITTRAGSLGEVAGDAALTVDPEDHVAIGGAIARVCRDDALRADLARRGRARAPAFSNEAQATGMLAVYRRALAEGRARKAAV